MAQLRGEEKKKPDYIITSAKMLSPQLGSSQEFLRHGQIDERKYANLNELTQAAGGYFAWRGSRLDTQTRKSFFTSQVEWELVSSQSIGGLRARQNIQAIAAESGSGKEVLDVAQKPNIVARHTTQRNWKEKALREGKVVPE